MDAPIFPTERKSETEFQATDLVVLPATSSDAAPAELQAGSEYRIERLANGWSWMQRPVGGSGADWSMVGKISDLPPYVPADRAQKVVKNRVAWHILDDDFQEKSEGTCDA